VDEVTVMTTATATINDHKGTIDIIYIKTELKLRFLLNRDPTEILFNTSQEYFAPLQKEIPFFRFVTMPRPYPRDRRFTTILVAEPIWPRIKRVTTDIVF